jgi:dipeptidyl aminopeptidase/acylaminoacyl peptidase
VGFAPYSRIVIEPLRQHGTGPNVPVELVLSGRELTEPRLSPDGGMVAFVQRWGSRAAIMVVDADGGPERAYTTAPDPAPGRGLSGGCFDWLPDGSGIVYVAADSELWLQANVGAPRQLTAFGRRCAAPAVSPDGRFVVTVVDEAEIWQVAIDSTVGSTVAGSSAVSRLDDGADAFCFDPVISPSSDTATWQAWTPPDMPWDGAHLTSVSLAEVAPAHARRWKPADAAVQQPRYANTGELLCVHDESGWLNVSLAGGGPIAAERFEHAGPTWGMGQRSFAPSPDGRHLAFARNEAGFGRLCVADRATGRVIDVGRGVHGQIGWVAHSVVALRSGARTPTQIVRYDEAAGWARTVLAVGPAAGWSHVELAEPQSVTVAHDGLMLYARRFAAGHGRMLVWIHGGPTDQWQVDFRPRVAYWWSRGWDVLVVDPRGSTGHGRAYQRALNGEWGHIDVADTATLVRHAHDEGWAVPASTVAIGSSSGGMAVLGLLADHGHLFAAGVASYPVSDLVGLTASTHRFEAHYNDTLVGPIDDIERYERLSPIRRADRILKPLLLLHGTDDAVVPIDQSDALARAIDAAGGRVDYIRYDGEGHGLRDPINQRDEYEQTERFVESVLAGDT